MHDTADTQSSSESKPFILHASCISWQGVGALILGDSGCGKSTLALTLMAYGCTLVADDRTILTLTPQGLLARCPDAIQGKIEARGVGLLQAETTYETLVNVAIDMGALETARFPDKKLFRILGRPITCLHNTGLPSFAPAVLQYLKSVRV